MSSYLLHPSLVLLLLGRGPQARSPVSPAAATLSEAGTGRVWRTGDGGDHTQRPTAPLRPGAQGQWRWSLRGTAKPSGSPLLDLSCLSSFPPTGAGAWLPPRRSIQQPWAVVASGHVSRTTGPFLPARERAAWTKAQPEPGILRGLLLWGKARMVPRPS